MSRRDIRLRRSPLCWSSKAWSRARVGNLERINHDRDAGRRLPFFKAESPRCPTWIYPHPELCPGSHFTFIASNGRQDLVFALPTFVCSIMPIQGSLLVGGGGDDHSGRNRFHCYYAGRLDAPFHQAARAAQTRYVTRRIVTRATNARSAGGRHFSLCAAVPAAWRCPPRSVALQ